MKYIIKNFILSASAFSIILSCGAFQRASNQQKGVAIGAGSGAVLGGVIGKLTGNTAVGAILGTAVGGVAGGFIGNRMDRQAERIKSEVPGATVERVGEGINVTFDEKSGVYFGFDQSNINSTSAGALNNIVKVFKEYPDTNILLEGHTDDKGADNYNMGLSQRRTIAVRDYFVKAGVSPSRLTAKWYGESQPKYPNTTEENRAKNRRVEIVITANEKMKAEAKKQAN